MLLIPVNDREELLVTHVNDGDEEDSSNQLPLWHRADEEVKRLVYPHLLVVPPTLQINDKDDDVEQASTRFLQVQQTLLVRPTQARPGLVAYHLPSSVLISSLNDNNNRRATCLAMTCGLWKIRLYGNVLLDWSQAPGSSWSAKEPHLLHAWSDALQIVLQRGPCHSPDHRLWTLPALENNFDDHCRDLRNWLLTAAQENYHDEEMLQRWTQLTAASTHCQRRGDDNDDDSSSSSSNSIRQSERSNDNSPLAPNDPVSTTLRISQEGPWTTEPPLASDASQSARRLVTMHEPLCLQCRIPTSTLCEQCQGAYFCSSRCRIEGWSHSCLCETWKVYVNRREDLSVFPFHDDWYKVLVTRACQISQTPYEDTFLTHTLGVPSLMEEETTALPQDHDAASSWWITERYGWTGGTSVSAQGINPQRRVSYTTGFAPLAPRHIPPETVVSHETWEALLSSPDFACTKNDAGLYRLHSWADYYALRGLPHDSPAALLLTFPLTLYYAVVEYGTVPWTVARMLNRPLRIDIVGAEKELHFVDLFQEVAFLLAGQVPTSDTTMSSSSSTVPVLELVFVIRPDMLPAALAGQRNENGGTYGLDITTFSPWLRARVVEGTYGDSLHPDLDCGSRMGAPDMVMAFNAGLYAYKSWRSVLKYLREHPNVVAMLSDYNEFSGVQCARLGGSPDTLQVNPFRQPRAMPVYSMNLPQFSNGFLYAINPQELE